MKLADYVADYIASIGVKNVFLVTGGAAAHIVDSIASNAKLEHICMQHEQAAAMAVEAYARVTGNFGVAVATSGPGATNLITGVCCAYFDSIPCMFISGQVNAWETKGKHAVRQLGFQETDIVNIVKPITKYVVMVEEPNDIRYHLEKAFYIAKHGRPGPVWIDIPMNVQHAEIDPDSLRSFDSSELHYPTQTISSETILSVVEALKVAKRPVIIMGAGIKIGGAQQEFATFSSKVLAPIVATWSGIDIIPYDHPLYIGHFGVYGHRAGNFTVQNADLVVSIGSRLDTRQTGGQPKTFAREAKKIVVDIDPGELHKEWVVADIPIAAHAKDFLISMNKQLVESENLTYDGWLERTKVWKKKYPMVLKDYHEQKNSVNAYVFVDLLAQILPEGSIIIADQGGNLTWTMQAFKVKRKQKLFSAFGNSPMGYAVPASIGAAFAEPGKDIICIDGDGGFQMNIQDLQTIVHYKLPIKMFILNNNSYGIIKQFQEIYFDARYAATDSQSGYSCPDFIKVANAYGIKTEKITHHKDLEKKIKKVLATPGPILCDVKLDEAQKLMPKLVAIKSEDGQRYISKPIEDMVPLLPREEFYSNMIVKPLDDGGGVEKSKEIN